MADIITSTKYPWQSKTIVFNVIGVVLAAASLFWPGANSVTVWMTANAPLLGTIWAVLNIVLRLVTKDAISLQD